jgi:hypothetical protein
MKAPFKTPVTPDTLIDFLKPEHADFIVTAINSHEELTDALEDAIIQLEYLDEKFEPTGTTAATITNIQAALVRGKSHEPR